MNESDAVRVLQRGEAFGQQALGLLQREIAVALHDLRQIRSRHELHRVPCQAGAPHDVVDADDVRMAEPRRELGLAPEALHDTGIGDERGMQDLDRHVAFEREVSRAIHPPEATAANLLEQLVVVAQGAAESPLEALFRHGGRCGGHLESARVADEVFHHLGGGVVALLRSCGKPAGDHALDCGGNRGPDLARRHDARGIEIGQGAGERGVDVRGHRVDVTRRLARIAGADFRCHIGERRISRREGLEIRETPVGIAQIGDDALTASIDHQGRWDDAPHDDAAGVRVLQRRQQIADQRHALRNGPRSAAQRIGETLAFDPVGRPVGERADLAGGVGVADRRMVERGECLGFAHEPRPAGRAGREMEPNGDGALQDAIPGVIQGPVRRQRHEVVESECRFEGT